MFKKHLISDPWKRALPDIEAETTKQLRFSEVFWNNHQSDTLDRAERSLRIAAYYIGSHRCALER
jgi:hypothetical protein